MTFVPAGEGLMGAAGDAFLARTETGLLVDRFEARWSDFDTWGMETVAGFEPELPATCDWYEAKRFARLRGMRLPTVSEWVYVATGGLPAGAKVRSSAANSLDLGVLHGTAVGSFESGRGPFGTYDQVGNVWEWAADHVSGMGISLDADVGLDVGGQVGMRTALGGSYMTLTRPLLQPGGVLPVFGQSLGPGHRAPDLGLRCVVGAREWLVNHAHEIGVGGDGDRQRLLAVGKQWAESGTGQVVVLLEQVVQDLREQAGLDVIELLLEGAGA